MRRVYPRVLEELLPAVWHPTERYANNRVECDHGRLKARLRPMRGLKQDRNATAIIAGHAFVQNLWRGPFNSAFMKAEDSAIHYRSILSGKIINRQLGAAVAS